MLAQWKSGQMYPSLFSPTIVLPHVCFQTISTHAFHLIDTLVKLN